MDVNLTALKLLLNRLKGLDDAASARALTEVGRDNPALLEEFRMLVEGARQQESNKQAMAEEPVLQSAIAKASQAPRVQHLASALEQMSAGSGGLMTRLATKSPGLAEALKQAMFRYSDLVYGDHRGLQLLLSKVDKKILRYALRGTDEALADKLYGQMSRRAAEQLREDLEVMGRVRKREVLDAQRGITDRARQMIKDGELIIIKPEDANEWVD
jgi:flagellar motor switch protein FliG